jgi:hypothetical protein
MRPVVLCRALQAGPKGAGQNVSLLLLGVPLCEWPLKVCHMVCSLIGPIKHVGESLKDFKQERYMT